MTLSLYKYAKKNGLKPLPKQIRVRWLDARHACDDGVERFRNVFGDRCDVTYENLMKAVENDLDFGWLASKFLVGDALNEYKRVCNNSRKENPIRNRIYRDFEADRITYEEMEKRLNASHKREERADARVLAHFLGLKPKQKSVKVKEPVLVSGDTPNAFYPGVA